MLTGLQQQTEDEEKMDEEDEEIVGEEGDSDDGDSSDPGEGDVSVIKIVSDDPWQAARAAAILKQVRTPPPFSPPFPTY